MMESILICVLAIVVAKFAQQTKEIKISYFFTFLAGMSFMLFIFKLILFVIK